MDTAQALLIAVVIVLTTMLAVIGIQVFHILKELRKTVEKTNKILDETGTITESVATPIQSLSSMVTGIQGGVVLGKIVKRLRDKSKEKD